MKTNQNIFDRVFGLFSLIHTRIHTTAFSYRLFDWLIVHAKALENADGNDSVRNFVRHHFQKLPFSPIRTRNGAFSKRCVFKKLHLLKPVSGPFSVDDSRKRISVVGALDIQSIGLSVSGITGVLILED